MIKKLSLHLLAVIVLMTLMPQISWASECYSRRQAEAEQGIRIHSELMVIGLNCQHMYRAGEKNLYRVYKEFTREHAGLIARYEDTLIQYFASRGHDRPEKALDNLRTRYANRISNDAAKMRPDMFCHKYAGRVPKAASYSRNQIRQWASTFYSAHPVSRPLCEAAY